jgi:F-type H+-transporting ATPase subunit a
MDVTPDHVVLWESGVLRLNATIVWTWVVMALLAVGSWAVTRGIRTSDDLTPGRNLLEAIVATIDDQIRDASGQDPRPFLPFVGTLFLFIVVSNVLSIVPGYRPPTGSLSTTAALAVCVFVAVPVFGIRRQGLGRYLRQYVQPSIVMLPFNVIGELSRTLALAVRLFGNVMIGVIQSYIFAILALIYIASATRAHDDVAALERSRESHG